MKRQGGMAVVMALLLVALAATASALVLWQQGLWWRRVDHDAKRAEIRQLARAGLDWARDILRLDMMGSGNITALSGVWAQPLPPTDANGMRFQGKLSDEQGKFNLRNLANRQGYADPEQLALYRRLLKQLELPDSLADGLLEWEGVPLTVPANPASATARSGNGHVLIRLASLRQVPGYDDTVLAKLEPLVTVLPEPSPINLNTAPLPLLQALLPDVGQAALAVLAQQRVNNYFTDAADGFRARLPAGSALPKVPCDVRSQYFLLRGELAREHTRYHLVALLERHQPLPQVVWQQEGAVLDSRDTL
jgi:general secretion pathway protein K